MHIDDYLGCESDTVTKERLMARSSELPEECKRHNIHNGGIAQHDCQGIFKFYYCESCYEEKKSHFIPSTWSGYTQADCDETIETEDGGYYNEM